jgi:hypothetical protein
MVKDCKKNRRGCMKNPLTNRWIKKDGETARNLKKHLSSLNEEGRAYKNGKGRYQNVPKHIFCGPAGGAPQGTFPVNNEKRCRAALSYAHNAPNPDGIRRCAVGIARKHKWECGTSSNKLKKSKICPSCGNKKCKCNFKHRVNKGRKCLKNCKCGRHNRK